MLLKKSIFVSRSGFGIFLYHTLLTVILKIWVIKWPLNFEIDRWSIIFRFCKLHHCSNVLLWFWWKKLVALFPSGVWCFLCTEKHKLESSGFGIWFDIPSVETIKVGRGAITNIVVEIIPWLYEYTELVSQFSLMTFGLQVVL